MEREQHNTIEEIKKMNAREMVDFISILEECEVLCNPYHSNPKGFDLYFVPKSFAISMLLHVELITNWADAHRYTVVLLYDTFKRAIVAKLNRLYPIEQYEPEDIIQ